MTTWRDLMPVHPAAEVFPMLDDADLLALGDDIKANGLKQPLVMWYPDVEAYKRGEPASCWTVVTASPLWRPLALTSMSRN